LELIDSRNNETSINSWDKESTFDCQWQPSQPISYLRLTQTGQNPYGWNRLVLSFIDFSGGVYQIQ
jgi:hypothetical protein